MIHLDRVALEIKTVGLYDLVLQDVQKLLGKTRVSESEILVTIESEPQILEDYKQINVEYNVSNLHVRDIEVETIDEKAKQRAQEINNNMAHLSDIEKYTLDFEQSSTLVIIFSVEFIVLFSVQYFIILLNLKEWQWELYSLFGSSILFAWWYAKKQEKKFTKNKIIFERKYVETMKMIDDLDNEGFIDKRDLVIAECEEHV